MPENSVPELTDDRSWSYYAVTRELGEGWNSALPMREQQQWNEHAVFMDALADDGFVVLGGPLGDGSRILLIIDAASEDEIVDRLAGDPSTPMGLLRTRRTLGDPPRPPAAQSRIRIADIRARCGVAGAAQRAFTVSTRAEEASVHHFIAYELHRQWLAQFEREAEVRRHLPKHERRRLSRFASLLPRSRRRAPLVARAAAKARACH